MNEENILPIEETIPESVEPPATEVPETAPEATDGSVETESSEPETVPQVETTVPEETEETIGEEFFVNETYPESTEAVVVVDVIESVGSDIVHANLFSGFLICGTLVGIAILRKIHGT